MEPVLTANRTGRSRRSTWRSYERIPGMVSHPRWLGGHPALGRRLRAPPKARRFARHHRLRGEKRRLPLAPCERFAQILDTYSRGHGDRNAHMEPGEAVA